MTPSGRDLPQLVTQLRATLGKMDLALSAITEGIVWTSPDGHVQWCNAVLPAMIGGSRLTTIGRDLADLLPLWRDGAVVGSDAHPAQLARQSPEAIGTGVYQFRHPDGRLAHLDIRWAGIESDGGRSVVLRIRDVTEQVTAEAILQRRTRWLALQQAVATAANEAASVQEAFQRSLAVIAAHTGWPLAHAFLVDPPHSGQLSPIATWPAADDTRFLAFRRATAAFVPTPGVGLPGRVWASAHAIWVEDLAQDATFVRREVATACGLRSGVAAPVLAADEVVAVLEFFHTEPLPDDPELRTVLAYVGVQLGRVVERQAAERALVEARDTLEERVALRTSDLANAHRATAESEARYRTLFEAAADVIFSVDADGTLTSLNPAFTALTGHAPEDWLGRPLLALVHPDDVPGALALRRDFERDLRLPLSQIRLQTAAGGTVVAEFSLRPLVVDGLAMGAFGVCRDVTARSELERVKDELLSTVSHELRTPLASLRGFTELMLKREFPAERRAEFLRVIHKESLRLTELIDDFLDLATIEQGRDALRLAPLHLHDVVREATMVYAEAHHGHRVVVDLPDTLPAVTADAARVRQVLANLLANAIKYSPAGGDVTVTAGVDGDHVRVAVHDHGIGIPPEAMRKLFSKFYRVDNSATRHIGGTGLGLALVKEIVERHHGTIGVESQLGVGSTFWFTLPRVAPARAGVAA